MAERHRGHSRSPYSPEKKRSRFDPRAREDEGDSDESSSYYHGRKGGALAHYDSRYNTYDQPGGKYSLSRSAERNSKSPTPEREKESTRNHRTSRIDSDHKRTYNRTKSAHRETPRENYEAKTETKNRSKSMDKKEYVGKLDNSKSKMEKPGKDAIVKSFFAEMETKAEAMGVIMTDIGLPQVNEPAGIVTRRQLINLAISQVINMHALPRSNSIYDRRNSFNKDANDRVKETDFLGTVGPIEMPNLLPNLSPVLRKHIRIY